MKKQLIPKASWGTALNTLGTIGKVGLGAGLLGAGAYGLLGGNEIRDNRQELLRKIPSKFVQNLLDKYNSKKDEDYFKYAIPLYGTYKMYQDSPTEAHKLAAAANGISDLALIANLAVNGKIGLLPLLAKLPAITGYRALDELLKTEELKGVLGGIENLTDKFGNLMSIGD